MSDVNKSTLRRLIEEMDRGNLDIVDELFAPDYVCYLQGGSVTLDCKAHKKTLETFYAAFPDYHHRIEDLIAEGDKVVLRVVRPGNAQCRTLEVCLPPERRFPFLRCMSAVLWTEGLSKHGWRRICWASISRSALIDEKGLEKAVSFIPSEDT